MGREIERKFLVNDPGCVVGKPGYRIRQGYLCSDRKRTVRVRTMGERAFLTVKSEWEGFSRLEYEYPIPLSDAEEMLDRLCDGPLIDKTRYVLQEGDHEWTVDIFYGDNEGLAIAEVELTAEEEAVEMPPWAGMEVTFDARYLNANLGSNPYRSWSHRERAS